MATIEVKKDSKILDTIRTAMVSYANETAFDTILVVYIEGAFMDLNQVGVGLEDLEINETTTWLDFLGEDACKTPILKGVYLYTTLYVRNLFDPPAPTVLTYMEELMKRKIWRLQIEADILANNGGVMNGKPLE